ncbi:beta-ketoacyl-ACP synthase 3 [Candidatus Woesearchaeota archaeon]|nr:beta-ketoacyl-ACP synthase 3 [Candidatus Woesearchaeota archaeon]
MENISIAGTGSYLPERVVDNKELEKLVRNYDYEKSGDFCKWAKNLTGVEKRHYAGDVRRMPFWLKINDLVISHFTNKKRLSWLEIANLFKDKYYISNKETTEEMAANAAKNALEAANMNASDIDLIILNTFTPHSKIPNPALEVGNLIGNGKAIAFPINTACSGFIYGLWNAYNAIKSGASNNVLVVSSETLSKVSDFDDPKTAVLWGDGAGAAVLKKSINGVLYMPYIGSEYSDHIKLNESKEDELVHMPGGPLIMRRAVNAMINAAKIVLEKNNLKKEDINWLIPHQANYRIIEDVAKELGMFEKMLVTIRDEGNISGGSIPRTLDKHAREGKIKRGDMILMTAIGGGYSFGAAIVKY